MHWYHTGGAAGTSWTSTDTGTSTGVPSCAQGRRNHRNLCSAAQVLPSTHTAKSTAPASRCSHRSEAAQPFSQEMAFTKIERGKCHRTAAKYRYPHRLRSPGRAMVKTTAARGFPAPAGERGMQGYGDTGMCGYRDAGMRGYRDAATQMQGYRDVGIQGRGDIRMQGCGDAEMWGCGDAGMWGYRAAGIQGCGNTRMQGEVAETRPGGREL